MSRKLNDICYSFALRLSDAQNNDKIIYSVWMSVWFAAFIPGFFLSTIDLVLFLTFNFKRGTPRGDLSSFPKLPCVPVFCQFFLICSLSLTSTYHLLPSSKIPFKEILLRFICPASLKQVYILAFPRICCRSSLVPHNLWETLTTVCTNEKKRSLHSTTKEILWLSKYTSTNTYIVE